QVKSGAGSVCHSGPYADSTAVQNAFPGHCRLRIGPDERTKTVSSGQAQARMGVAPGSSMGALGNAPSASVSAARSRVATKFAILVPARRNPRFSFAGFTPRLPCCPIPVSDLLLQVRSFIFAG